MKSPSTDSIYNGIPLSPEIGSREGDCRSFWPTAETPDTISQYETVKTTSLEADFDFKIERTADTGRIVSIIAHSPDEGIRTSLVVGKDTVNHKAVIDRSSRHQTIEWRRYQIFDINFTADNRLNIDLLFTNNPRKNPGTTISSEEDIKDGEYIKTVSAANLCESLADRTPNSTWHHNPSYRVPGENPVQQTKAYLPPNSEYKPIDSCSDLNFRKIEGEGAKKEVVNPFLAGSPDGTVNHSLGTVEKWKAAFGAYHNGQLIAVLILTNHQNQAYFQEHNEVMIKRIACHPTRPKNTATWMIARARNWAEHAGYDKIGAHAGVGDNRGMIYKAAGFELDERLTRWAKGDSWCNRDGREPVRDGNLWYRRKWSDELNPES
jgi:hypothetical protein